VDDVTKKINAALQKEEEFKLDFYEYGNKVADS
jgi:hypothetical protein